MKAQRARVLIRYNLHNELPAEVLVHEIPVLRAIRGANNITFEKILATLPEEVSPRAEYLRLKQEYQSQRDGEGTNPVDAAYPDGSRDLEIILRDGLEAFDRATAGEVIETEDTPLVFSDEDPDPETVGDDDDEPVSLDRAAVMQKLSELNVDFSVNTPTKHLIEKLHAAEASQ